MKNFILKKCIAFRARIKRVMIFMLSFGRPKKKVLFDSFGGTQYSADPRAISEKMHDMYPEYEIVWVLHPDVRDINRVILPNYVRVVDGKLGYIRELATSTAYVTTEPLTKSFYKRKGQLVVQTWHGDRGMKKALYQMYEGDGKTRSKIYDNEYTDICVAGSDFGEIMYRTGFKYFGEILKMGMPKNDKLVNFDINEKIRLRTFFEIPEGYKVLTYAPTFRGHSINEQEAEIDIKRTLDAVESRGDKWVCLIRAHVHSKGINYSIDDERIIDVSKYPDMADILVITDMLITDYSSCAGDFLIKKKPVILVINDEEEYKKNSRSFRVDLSSIGYILSHNQDELDTILRTTQDETYTDACEKALAFYVTNETGYASEVICNRINENYIRIMGKEKEYGTPQATRKSGV